MSDPKIAIFTSLNDNLRKFDDLCEFAKVMIRTLFETQTNYKYDCYMCIDTCHFSKWMMKLYPYSRNIKFIKGYCPDDLDRNLKPWWNKIFTSVELLKNYDVVIHVDYDTIVFNSFKERIDYLCNSDCDTCSDIFKTIDKNKEYYRCDVSFVMFHKRSLLKFKNLQSDLKEFAKDHYHFLSEEIYLGEKKLKNCFTYRNNFNIDLNKLTYSELYNILRDGLVYHLCASAILCDIDKFILNLSTYRYNISITLNGYFLMRDYFPKMFITKVFTLKFNIMKKYNMQKCRELWKDDIWCKNVSEVLLDEFNKLEHIV